MTTAAEIVRGALDKLALLSAVKKVNGNDAEHCLAALNTMIDSWKLSPTFAVATVETVVPLTGATASLTIGPGQQVDIERPVRIEYDTFVRVSGIDYPLQVLDRAGFNAISQKTLGSSWPQAIHYDAGMPTGTLRFWPQGQGELHLVTQGHVAGGNFADLTTNYLLPPGYKRAFIYGLAEEVAPDFQVEPSVMVLRLAQTLRRQVKRANQDVPQLAIPGRTGRYTEADFIAGR